MKTITEPLPKFPDPYPANWDSMTKEQKGQWVVDWNKSDEARARHAKWEHVFHTRRYYPFAVDEKEMTFRIEDVEPKSSRPEPAGAADGEVVD